jgi:hypothetical protein
MILLAHAMQGLPAKGIQKKIIFNFEKLSFWTKTYMEPKW